MKNKTQLDGMPVWFDGKRINEALFCEEFLQTHKIIFTNGAFFTPESRVTDELPLRGEIFEELKCCAVSNIPRKISNVVELMKLAALVEDFPPEPDRIHLSNGTLFLDGTFAEGKPKIVRNRFPVAYNPNAPKPVLWLQFLDGLLYPEDIPTLQEYIGYCLIPSNKGQRMMVIKGSGGEGKSQIGAVLGTLFGSNMKDGSIGKISENRFARADLEHILLCVDDDMRMEALRQTNYVKSIVTAQGKMDLERKGKQSYQGWMCARLLAFSNGDLQALFDRSDGFYRRQLVLTTKEKPAGRVDDPDLAEKMKAEVEGILLWAFEGLQRLAANNFKFTESERTRENREAVKRDNNNVYDFLDSDGYVRLKADLSASSKELYEAYQIYCTENNLPALNPRSFSEALIACQRRYNLEYCNNVTNAAGRRVRGFLGIEVLVRNHILIKYDNANLAARTINQKYGFTRTQKTWFDMIRSDFYCGIHKGVEDFCEPYVSVEDWLRFQQSRSKVPSTKQNRTYLFSGMIRCPVCGRLLCGTSTVKDQQSKKEYFSYRCRNRYTATCNYRKTVAEIKTERHLLKYLDKYLEKEIANVELKAAQPKPKPKVNINALREKLRRLDIAYMAGNRTDEEYLTEQAEIKKSIAQAEKECPPEKPRDLTVLKETLESDFRTIYKGMDKLHQQRFWRGLLKEIYVEGNDVKGVKFIDSDDIIFF